MHTADVCQSGSTAPCVHDRRHAHTASPPPPPPPHHAPRTVRNTGSRALAVRVLAPRFSRRPALHVRARVRSHRSTAQPRTPSYVCSARLVRLPCTCSLAGGVPTRFLLFYPFAFRFFFIYFFFLPRKQHSGEKREVQTVSSPRARVRPSVRPHSARSPSYRVAAAPETLTTVRRLLTVPVQLQVRLFTKRHRVSDDVWRTAVFATSHLSAVNTR